MAESDPRPTPEEASPLIRRLGDGDAATLARLLPQVYQELRALAQSYFEGQRRGHTLQPTALVHEAFVRLAGNADIAWEGKTHFLAVAAKAMRRVLADHARVRRAAKRGGDWERVTLSGIGSNCTDPDFDALDIDEALSGLEKLSERQGRIVELRFFGGLTVPEVARVLGVSTRTVEGEWYLARAWLRQRLGAGERG